jgi:hypothetical protein
MWSLLLSSKWRTVPKLKSLLLVGALDNRTIDREARAPECLTTEPGKQAVLHEGKNLELLTQLTSASLQYGTPLFLMTNLLRLKKSESTGIRKIAKEPGLDS